SMEEEEVSLVDVVFEGALGALEDEEDGMDEEDDEVVSMEEEEVSLVDGVFEGAFGALALEIEALVDAVEVYGV
nr:hypothetical protein [Tanacetum cinerariifolium]